MMRSAPLAVVAFLVSSSVNAAPARLVVKTGDVVPGGTVIAIYNGLTNQAGQVYFEAQVDSGTSIDFAYYLWTPAGGVTRLATAGDAIPDASDPSYGVTGSGILANDGTVFFSEPGYPWEFYLRAGSPPAMHSQVGVTCPNNSNDALASTRISESGDAVWSSGCFRLADGELGDFGSSRDADIDSIVNSYVNGAFQSLAFYVDAAGGYWVDLRVTCFDDPVCSNGYPGGGIYPALGSAPIFTFGQPAQGSPGLILNSFFPSALRSGRMLAYIQNISLSTSDTDEYVGLFDSGGVLDRIYTIGSTPIAGGPVALGGAYYRLNDLGDVIVHDGQTLWGKRSGGALRIANLTQPMLGEPLITPTGAALVVAERAWFGLYTPYVEGADGDFDPLLPANSTTVVLTNGQLLEVDTATLASTKGRGTGSDGSLISGDGRVLAYYEHSRSGVGGDDERGLVLLPLSGADTPAALTDIVVNTNEDSSTGDDRSSQCTDRNYNAGVPSCSLRNAIALANRQGTPATIHLSPGVIYQVQYDDLPAITAPITIDGGEPFGNNLARIQPHEAGWAMRGLVVDASEVRIESVIISDFDIGILIESNGDVLLSNVHLDFNGTWGIYADGHLRVSEWDHFEPPFAARSSITNNGFDWLNANHGGGIRSARAYSAERDEPWQLELVDVDITGNNGPGVDAEGKVFLGRATVSHNGRHGVFVGADDGSIATTVYTIVAKLAPSDVNVIEDNVGSGIHDTSGIVFIEAPNTIIKDNHGWGIFAEVGRVDIGSVTEVLDSHVQIAANGFGDDCFAAGPGGGVIEGQECHAGGVFSGGSYASNNSFNTFYNVDIVGNNGPGALLAAGLRMAHVKVDGNNGQGIASLGSRGANGADVSVSLGELGVQASTFSHNKGHGIHVEWGRLSLNGMAQISGNAGWGIYADNTSVSVGVTVALQLDERHVIADNGFTETCARWGISDGLEPERFEEPCTSGGVFSEKEMSTGGVNGFRGVNIENNGGPGILSAAPVVLARAKVSGNVGQGIARVAYDLSNENSGPAVAFESPIMGVDEGCEVSGNAGDGIFAEEGDVQLYVPVAISGNAGWGIHTVLNDINIGPMNAGVTGRTAVEGNGDVAFCDTWTIANGVPAEITTACTTGGLWSEEDDVTIYSTDVRDNTGEGIRAGNLVTLTDSVVCDNSTYEILMEGTPVLIDSEVCSADDPPPPPDSDGDGDDDDNEDGGAAESGGCNASGPSCWMLLGLLGAWSARRRA